jgi:hypothetical protein
MGDFNNNVDRCLETLCYQGCARVSAYIEALRGGQVFAEVADLNAAERKRVLDELVSVIAPYEANSIG